MTKWILSSRVQQTNATIDANFVSWQNKHFQIDISTDEKWWMDWAGEWRANNNNPNADFGTHTVVVKVETNNLPIQRTPPLTKPNAPTLEAFRKIKKKALRPDSQKGVPNIAHWTLQKKKRGESM
jgi:hypothetical protein